MKPKPSHKLNQRYKVRRNPKYEVRSVWVLPRNLDGMMTYMTASIKVGGTGQESDDMAYYFTANKELGGTPYIAYVDVMCRDMRRKFRHITNNKRTITVVSFRVDEMAMYKLVKDVMPIYWRKANKINRYR